MAEIRVEKKSRPVWPWIVGLLLLAAIIWIVVDSGDDVDDRDEVAATEMEEAQDNTLQEAQPNRQQDMNNQNAPMAYVSFVEENEEEITMQHEYSNQALTHLSNALSSVADGASAETQQKLDDLKQKANAITQNTNSTQHANMLAEAFTTAAGVMESLQQEMFPDLQNEVKSVRDAANEVDPNVMVNEQKDAVKKFFHSSADAIEAMSEQDV